MERLTREEWRKAYEGEYAKTEREKLAQREDGCRAGIAHNLSCMRRRDRTLVRISGNGLHLLSAQGGR